MAGQSLARRWRHADTTANVTLDRRACEACGQCVETCPNGVLRMIRVGPHRHAKIAAAEACTGCLACVRGCEAGALARRDEARAGGRAEA
jgi:NAD-dependent dihydropyrimidine dehydrogenase PreA subunit